MIARTDPLPHTTPSEAAQAPQARFLIAVEGDRAEVARALQAACRPGVRMTLAPATPAWVRALVATLV